MSRKESDDKLDADLDAMLCEVLVTFAETESTRVVSASSESSYDSSISINEEVYVIHVACDCM